MATIESLQLSITANSKKAVSGIEALTQSLEKLKSATSGGLGLSAVSEQLNQIGGSSKNASSALNSLGNSSNKTSGSFTDLFNKGRLVINILSKVGKTIWKTIEASSDYTETLNLFNVAMGEYASSARGYADTVSEIMGINPEEWMKSQGVFMTMATGFGIAGDRAAKMSEQLTQLSYDISSFYNISSEEAFLKLKSGLAGELEPLRAIGYDLSQAKLEATALELGIDKAVSSMTQAEKAQLRYYAIMTQVTTTHGDMARTLDQPANQIRVLKAQIEMAAKSIGDIFIPALQAILPYAIAVTKVVREIADGLASLVNPGGESDPSEALEKASEAADSTSAALDEGAENAKKLKSYMLGFDELNVINPNTDSAEDASGAFDFELPEYDFLSGATNEKIEGIKTQIQELIQPIRDLIDTTVSWAKELDLEPISKGFKEIGDSLGSVLSQIGDLFGWVYEDVLLPIAKWAIEAGLPAVFEAIAKALEMVGKAIKPVIDGIKELKPVLEPIVSWIGDALIDVFDGLGSIFGNLGTTFEENGGKITGIITGIGDIISTVWSLIEPLLSTVWVGVVDFLGEVSNSISPIGTAILELADVVINDLSGAFKGLAEILEPLATFVEKVFSEVFSEILSPIFEDLTKNILPMLITTITNLWNDVLVPLGELVGSILAPIIQIVSDLLTYLWTYIILPLSDTLYGEFSDAFMELGDDLNGKLIPILNIVIKVFTFLWNNILSPLTNFLLNTLKPIFENVFKEIGNAINSLSQVFGGLIDILVGSFTGDWKRVWGGILELLVGVWNGIVGAVESGINWLIRGINGLIAGLSSVVEWVGEVMGQDWGGITLIPEVKFNRLSIPAYAEGGFPEQGQMFIANEAGAEMVGSIGRRTAVANNDQIVAGIAGGVAEANEEQNALLREQNSLLRELLNKDNSVYLDGKPLTNSVEKYQRERGRVLITGGVI